MLGGFFKANAQQTGKIHGQVLTANAKASAATVYLLKAQDSSFVKAAITDNGGSYAFDDISFGSYLISATTTGQLKGISAPFTLDQSTNPVLAAPLKLSADIKKMDAVTVVSTKKPMIENKAGKIIFNVENSINATGSNALELLRKSPGVVIDNNEAISMKGKNGVKIYIDGKISQLDEKALADFLKSINSSDIEAIEMISNPGAKYDAEGNAGVINIRLKKNKKYGTNGTAGVDYRQGNRPNGGANVSLNYRDKKINIFSNVSVSSGSRANVLKLYRVQNDTIYDQRTHMGGPRTNLNFKVGADYFLNSRNTIGVAATTFTGKRTFEAEGATNIYTADMQPVKTLEALNSNPVNRTNANLNLNYRYADTSGTEVSADADYGFFKSRGTSYQPNDYYNTQHNLIYNVTTGTNTPVDIHIYTLKSDAETKLGKGKLGFGAKYSNVKTENSYEFFNYQNNVPAKSMNQSNDFTYTENINAAYANYNRDLSKSWSLQAGLRVEQTKSTGTLTRADGTVQADNVVKRNYTDVFPSASLNYTLNAKNSFGLAYTRRIDRPDYQDLNPFEDKLDELTYHKGNAFLKPQYTDNIELSHTFASKLNTALSYSYVKDYSAQITDTANRNATFVQDQNIAAQKIYNLNISCPITVNKWWSIYVSTSYNYQTIKGGYNNVKVDISASNYGAYMQHTFNLGKSYKAEFSGWYNSPGIEGTWKRKGMGAMDLGIQKQLFKNRATLKMAVNDFLNSADFNAHNTSSGIILNINQADVNRQFVMGFNYRFGNNNVKAARQHKTGLESEGNRIK